MMQYAARGLASCQVNTMSRSSRSILRSGSAQRGQSTSKLFTRTPCQSTVRRISPNLTSRSNNQISPGSQRRSYHNQTRKAGRCGEADGSVSSRTFTENGKSNVFSSALFSPHTLSSFYSSAYGQYVTSLPWSGTCVPIPERSIPVPEAETPSSILACSTITKVHEQEWRTIRQVVKAVRRWARRFWHALLITLRGTDVALRLSPLLVLTPAAILSSRLAAVHNTNDDEMSVKKDQDGSLSSGFSDTNNKQKRRRRRNAKTTKTSDFAWWYTLRTIQSLGPAFVKLAQWAATRRDLFPPHICDRLSELHDAAHIHSWKYTEQILQEAFGMDYESKGLKIDQDDIIGSGSAAQVYRGTLTVKEDNDEDKHTTKKKTITKNVAVKVLHPNIQALVERDLLLMERVAELLDSLPFEALKMLSLPRATQNFGSILRRQVDLRVEGNNLEQFHENFFGSAKKRLEDKRHDVPKVSFPRPVEGWVDQNVLVEEYVSNATPISEFLCDSTEEGMELRRELAGPLLRAFLKMIFLDNFVHCDLHPGNVMVQTTMLPRTSRSLFGGVVWNNSDKEDLRREHTIIFLDAGIATSLSKNDQRNLRDLFRAVILNDGDTAGRLMVERARYESCSQTEGCVESFASGVGAIVSEFHDRRRQGLTLGAVRIGSLLSRVLDLCRTHGVEIDPAMSSVVISTLVLEGLGRSLEPNLNLIDCAIPFVLGRGKV